MPKPKTKQKILSELVKTRPSEFKLLNWYINFGFNVEKILFARILATLLRSGINIADSLIILEEQFVGKFKYVVAKIRKDVETGQELSMALSKFPKYFSRVFIGLVLVGEKSGRLAETLKRAADQMEKDLELNRKVQSASLYPALVLICLLALAALLSYYILPQLVVIFTSFYLVLPWTTRALLAMAAFIRDYGLLFLVLLLAGIIFLNFIVKTKKIRPYWQGFLISLPFLGELIKKLNLARFCRILGILLQSGVAIKPALETTIESLTNEVYKNELKRIKGKITAGESLGEAMRMSARINLFPNLLAQMVSVGERTGSLEDNLLYLAEYYEGEVDNIAKNLSNVVEPVLLIIVGFLVAFIAIAIISPIYEFIATLSQSI
ncbi:MAG TPA: type II secretion system F family protein [Candidatus Uhrbacteria bacterium]|nr:type II secretion system F family protein [Candidatus Uhrbacteria bacterium]